MDEILKKDIKYFTDSVISRDGTKIGYRFLGSGPGVIIVHGGIMASQNFMKLAYYLSSKFTVFIHDRRGRGLSGPPGDDYSLMKEIDDIRALVQKTGAKNLFGLSSGAVIALESAMMVPELQKVAAYEPPLMVNGLSPVSFVDKYEAAMKNGNIARAFAVVSKGIVEKPFIVFAPVFIIERILERSINMQHVSGDEVALRALIPTMHYDIKLVSETTGFVEKCASLRKSVLLLGGTRSRGYLKKALDALEKVLPDAKRIKYKGFGHMASTDAGRPDVIAKDLIDFFNS
jgi:pimeloyl-ACP methyl ester carboxylesterase